MTIDDGIHPGEGQTVVSGIDQLLVGATAFIMCTIGVKVGNKFGKKYKKKAQIFGGIVVILIGLKILFEHLGILF